MKFDKNKKSKIFNFVFFVLIFVSIAVVFYRYIIMENYRIFTDEEVFSTSLEEY